MFVGRLKLRANTQGVIKSAGLQGDHLRDAVHVPIGHAQSPANVTEGRLGAKGPKGDDLGHPVIAVAIDDVVEDFVPAVVLEVQVDVGHLFAFQIEEALEDQAVLQWVNVSNSQAIQGHAGGGAAADPVEYVAPPNEADDVPDHQEVVGEARMANDVQLVAEPVFGFRRSVGVAAAETFFA